MSGLIPFSKVTTIEAWPFELEVELN